MPDYAGAIDALAHAGRITAPAALAAKAVIGLIARGTDQEAGGVALPLTLRDRTLALGQIPLAEAAGIRLAGTVTAGYDAAMRMPAGTRRITDPAA